jgi:hypothetical protein
MLAGREEGPGTALTWPGKEPGVEGRETWIGVPPLDLGRGGRFGTEGKEEGVGKDVEPVVGVDGPPKAEGKPPEDAPDGPYAKPSGLRAPVTP